MAKREQANKTKQKNLFVISKDNEAIRKSVIDIDDSPDYILIDYLGMLSDLRYIQH